MRIATNCILLFVVVFAEQPNSLHNENIIVGPREYEDGLDETLSRLVFEVAPYFNQCGEENERPNKTESFCQGERSQNDG